MTDPFDALRTPSVPVAPDPEFARALRARLERALLAADEEPAPSAVRPGQLTYAAFWTRDVAQADRFYARVLGWRTVPSPNGDGLPTRQVNDLAVPLGLRRTDRAPTLAPYYAVPDVDATVALVRAAGGTAAQPRDRAYGRAAECSDDQGLPFTLVAPSGGGPGRRPAGPGELDYVLLRVPDTTRARAFYGTVLGWRFRPGTGPGYWHPEPAGGPTTPAFGLEGGHADAVVVPWFRVPDLDAALASVRAAGGRGVGPVRHQRGGPRAECADDQGARFGLAQL